MTGGVLSCEKAEADSGELGHKPRTLKPSEAGRAEGDPPRAFEWMRTSQYLDFRLPVSSTVTETFLQFLAPQIMVIVAAAQEH